jgi:hypothetical protein
MMSTVDSHRRGGRRLHKLEKGEKITVGLRIDSDLRARLEDAARASDRNLSQECARRLRLSLEQGDGEAA